MKIRVVLIQSAENITLDVVHTDTVKRLKERIAKIQGIPVDEQRYIFDQKALKDDDALLADIGVKEWSVIYECTVASDT